METGISVQMTSTATCPGEVTSPSVSNCVQSEAPPIHTSSEQITSPAVPSSPSSVAAATEEHLPVSRIQPQPSGPPDPTNSSGDSPRISLPDSARESPPADQQAIQKRTPEKKGAEGVGSVTSTAHPSTPKSPVVRGGKGVAFAKSAPSPAKAKAPRTPRKKVPLAMYQSQISDNKIGIKICIKKSVDVVVAKTKKVVRKVTGKAASTTSSSSKKTANKTLPSSSSSPGSAKKRGKKRKALDDSDSDEMNYRRRRRKENNNETCTKNNNNNLLAKDVSIDLQQRLIAGGSASGALTESSSPEEGPNAVSKEQSCWALTMPENVLANIFQYVTASEGCLPTLVRLGSVSSLWRRVAQQPSLWHTMDLTTWVKERHRNELKLKWFILNRLGGCTDLNLASWKVMNVQCVLDLLAENCPRLSGLILSGWKSLMSDHLIFIATKMKNLQRIDLSAINTEVNANKTAVGLQSLSNAVQAMGDRLRHLHLANNRLGGLPQLINSLASHCPNLALLDLSNITTMAVSHAVLPLEKLQTGCPKLKVFRITNAQVTLGTATLQEQMDAPGFPELEELSIASFSRTICDDFVQRILKKSTKLKLLDVRGCPRITHESLIRLPAWDLKHLFLSGCTITRDVGSGLELIASKWAHSLVEFDLAWGNAQRPLDNALRALADKRGESRLNHLDLCGSSVSLEAVQEILTNCPNLNSINLSSCRSLPRGMKRLLQGPAEMKDLREALGVELKVQPTAVTDL